MNKTEAWYYLNGLKEQTIKHLPKDQWLDVKLACDQLFQIFTRDQYKICPSWFFHL
jgi:hypothetical protein